MGTRSAIGIMNGDVCQAIYCHWDGYLSNNGMILERWYRSEAKVKQLIELGDLSSLGEYVGKQHDFDDRTHRDWCKFYGRDRGETDVGSLTFTTYDEFFNHYSNLGCEYFYIMKDGVWFFATDSQPSLKLLQPAVEQDIEEDLI